MTYNIYRYEYDWKNVKGNLKSPLKLCPRCGNNVCYQLVFDGDGYGFPGLWTFKYNKIYAFKCPICPNYELVEKELAKAIIKGG
jgi:hypothetical protein